ncbi:hypothetical protein ABR737_37875 [Streptomyces sp. Edi2]|uniref:hypothetical protein n=1 Tax=Streptomyces sp. Edi2 TaxID=3162528 RepID=UPI0033061199
MSPLSALFVLSALSAISASSPAGPSGRRRPPVTAPDPLFLPGVRTPRRISDRRPRRVSTAARTGLTARAAHGA